MTFGALKTGLLVDPGAAHAGVVELVDIGLDLPPAQTSRCSRRPTSRPCCRAPDRESDKYRRGVVGVAAGSAQYTGAAVLAPAARVRGGAGMVRYVGAADAVGAGPRPLARGGRRRGPGAGLDRSGSGGGGDAADRLRASGSPTACRCVVDADALRSLRRPPATARAAPVLLTPHAGELARLLGADRADVEARRLRHAPARGAGPGAVVLLKGSTTVVARPDGRSRVNPTGTPALATAGTGDVLAGLCGALLAGGLDPFDAGSVGA